MLKSLLLLVVFFGATALAAGQLVALSTAYGRPKSFFIRFGPTKGIDKTFRFSNGMATTFLIPEVILFAGSQEVPVALEKLGAKREKRLASAGSSVVVRHHVNALDYFDYLFDETDSVVVSYPKGLPAVAVAGRSPLPYDYTFERYLRARFVKDKYSPLSVFANPFYFYDFGRPLKANESLAERMSRIRQTNLAIRTKTYEKAFQLLRAEDELLDSLKSHRLLSEKPYQFYKDRASNLRCILAIETNRLSGEQLQPLLLTTMARPAGCPALYHYKLLEAAADTYITDKAPLLDVKDGVNRDYRQVYLRLSQSTIFPEKDKHYLLARELRRIAQTFSKEDFLVYFKRFEQEVPDTALVLAVKKQYALAFDASQEITKSVVLQDIQGVRLTFDDLLKRHRGKVIYVDFWASWCAPCREALPHSLKLRDELTDQPVVFIYLSIDKLPAPWHMASDQEKLLDYPENYLIINHLSSHFLKQQQVSSIPRYMLFDKTGKLAYATAPAAESEHMADLLKNLAK